MKGDAVGIGKHEKDNGEQDTVDTNSATNTPGYAGDSDNGTPTAADQDRLDNEQAPGDVEAASAAAPDSSTNVNDADPIAGPAAGSEPVAGDPPAETQTENMHTDVDGLDRGSKGSTVAIGDIPGRTQGQAESPDPQNMPVSKDDLTVDEQARGISLRLEEFDDFVKGLVERGEHTFAILRRRLERLEWDEGSSNVE